MASDYLKTLQSGLTPNQKFNQITEHGMCIGCGICQSLVGPEKIKMEIVANGYERPLIQQTLKHAEVDKIMDVCPGTRVEGMPESLVDEGSKNDDVWGIFQEIYFSYAASPRIRHMASTGGLLTGLGLYLIESGEVDFILHAHEPSHNPTFGQPFISRSVEQVLEASGSRYGPTATLEDIVEVLNQAEEKKEKFAFIGTPCDISALRNYARHDERVDRYCLYMLTMVCGGFMEPAGMRKFLKNLDVNFDEVTSLRYRGYGCPGPTTIKTQDGRVISKNYLEFWGEDDSAWQLPPRCKVCPDGIGDSADIAASDTWDGGSPDWVSQKTDLGSNAAVVRTRRGCELMDRAIQSGYLIRGDSLTVEDMNRFQPHQETKKRMVWARFSGMKMTGHIVPDTKGLRLQSLFHQNSDSTNENEMNGTRSRVEAGKFSEDTPAKL
ncbi:MAG: hydrogenase [Gammaproteobacteria bacterium]|nr:hydrogenase [Gammaproteobacteria bacterium]